MSDDDLERAYRALQHALERVGEAKGELFLSMTCLALMAHRRIDDVLDLIGNVEAQCAAEVLRAPEEPRQHCS